MRPEDIPEVLQSVKAHWPHFALSLDDVGVRAQAQAWWMVLHDVDLPVVLRALAKLDTAGREFAPTAGQVRAVALPSSAPDADEAVAEIFEQIRGQGWCGSPAFSHPAIEAAIAAIGGWREVCASENPEALRAHLRTAYETAAKRARQDSLPELTPPARFELGTGDDG